ncbi:hypothetical protein ACTXT7_015977, partial [Hymenolepis weldensis]
MFSVHSMAGKYQVSISSRKSSSSSSGPNYYQTGRIETFEKPFLKETYRQAIICLLYNLSFKTIKTDPVSNVVLPSNPEEDKSFHDFLNVTNSNSNSPSHSTFNKPVLMYENLDSNEPHGQIKDFLGVMVVPGDSKEVLGSLNSVPVVAAFQEDLDPDDTAENLAALSFGLNGSTASPPSPVLRTADSSMDDIDDDDADLMNEDSDDDEEHLGPALGLTSSSSPPVVNGDDLSPSPPLPKQKFQLSAFLSTSSSSSSSSGSSSRRHSFAILQKIFSHPPPDGRVDPITAEEKSAFERFLDDFIGRQCDKNNLQKNKGFQELQLKLLRISKSKQTSSQGKFIGASIIPCNEDPCVLEKGHNTSINIQFIPAELVKGGKIVVHGIISGIPVPFPLPDNNLCHFLKSGCDAQPNVPTEMDYSLYVKETYPSIHIGIKWQLVDDLGVDLVCIKFPAKLQSALYTIKS